MKDARFFWGMLLTVTWLGAAALLLYWKRAELAAMSPNAWGDFFAGCFSPIALLWLVLGYLQQGEELKLNTRALHVQADELKQSVAQQRALVDLTRLQLDSEIEARQFERAVQARSAKPQFSVRTGKGTARENQRFGYVLWIKNLGAPVTGVQADFWWDTDLRTRVADVGLLDRGGEVECNWLLADPLGSEEACLCISYNDFTNTAGKFEYVVRSVDPGNPKRGLMFSQVIEDSLGGKASVNA